MLYVSTSSLVRLIMSILVDISTMLIYSPAIRGLSLGISTLAIIFSEAVHIITDIGIYLEIHLD